MEEYIAGVVKQEFGGSASNDENRLNVSKVNAIAARSFLMAQTGCTSVVNGESFQAYRVHDLRPIPSRQPSANRPSRPFR